MNVSEPRPILLLGGSGQLGAELQRALGSIRPTVAPTSRELDICDRSRVRDALDAIRPAAIVNAAAYTDVDGAESDRDRAFRLNAEAPGDLARLGARLSIPLVHFSTDYVFDGQKQEPYLEDDETRPLNHYGASKLQGERQIMDAGGEALVLRTAWLYGWSGANFVTAILGASRSRQTLEVVADQIGQPTWTRDLAHATAKILAAPEQNSITLPVTGIVHIAAAGAVTRYDLARTILDLDTEPQAQICKEILPITTEQTNSPANRPLDSRLDCGLLRRSTGIELPHWQDSLREMMRNEG